eukprot:3551242-Pleurochrysis_carterae.AAC.2
MAIFNQSHFQLRRRACSFFLFCSPFTPLDHASIESPSSPLLVTLVWPSSNGLERSVRACALASLRLCAYMRERRRV